MRGVPAREQFLQHALGTQGDVRVPAVLLSLAALLAVLAVAWRRMKRGGPTALDDDLPEIEGRDDLEPQLSEAHSSQARTEDPGRGP